MAAFAYIYSTAEQDVADGAAVVFNSPTTLAPIAYTVGGSTISLSQPGNYLVSFQVSAGTGGGGTWAIAAPGVTIPLSYTSRSGNTQIFGEAIITVGAAPVTVSIVNQSGGSVSLVNGLAPSPDSSVSASVTILKLN